MQHSADPVTIQYTTSTCIENSGRLLVESEARAVAEQV